MKVFRRLFDREIALTGKALRRALRLRPNFFFPTKRELAGHKTRARRKRPGFTEAPRQSASLLVVKRRSSTPKSSLIGVATSVVVHLTLAALLFSTDRENDRTQPREPSLLTVRLSNITPKRQPKPPQRPVFVPRSRALEVEEPLPELARPLPEKVEAPPAESIADREFVAQRGTTDLEAPSLRRPTALNRPVLGTGASSARSNQGNEGELFHGRGRGRAETLARHGGSTGTENAVTRGLFWLAAHQDNDGGWDVNGFNRHCQSFTQCFGKGQPQFDVGVTALATLAFLGAGHSPAKPSTFSEVVRKALNYLLKLQEKAGNFSPVVDEFFYNHSIATLAMAEAYGIHNDVRYHRSARRALEFSAKAQQSGGGWDYTTERTGRNDLSITGWQIMAMKTAQELDIPFDTSMLERTRGFLGRCIRRDGTALYADSGVAAGRKGINMVAVGMLSRLYVGDSPDAPGIRHAQDRILRNPPELEKTYDWERHFQSSYYVYSATLAMFQLGGAPWEAWNHFLKQSVLPHQSAAPHEDGSWEPDGNWLGVMGGRLASTALNVLTFEVYYRYPPLVVNLRE